MYVINNKQLATLKEALNYQNDLLIINRDNFVDILNKKKKAINTHIIKK